MRLRRVQFMALEKKQRDAGRTPMDDQAVRVAQTPAMTDEMAPSLATSSKQDFQNKY